LKIKLKKLYHQGQLPINQMFINHGLKKKLKKVNLLESKEVKLQKLKENR